jgi:hypothetical protein
MMSSRVKRAIGVWRQQHLVASALLVTLALLPGCQTLHQAVFDSPYTAATALVEACAADDEQRLEEILGSEHRGTYATADHAADTRSRLWFAEAADQDLLLRHVDKGLVQIVVGSELWPMPIPLVKVSAGWQFDTAAGAEEIINRRVGENELRMIEVCRELILAQELFKDRDWDNNGEVNYARRLISTPGEFDGLYWKPQEDVLPSPLEKYVDENVDYLELREAGSPVYGYRGRLLFAQGSNAPDGAMDFMEGDRLLDGWAAVLWPAEYGTSGVLSFLVSHHGTVYEQDLGEASAEIATTMTMFDPDDGWTEVGE